MASKEMGLHRASVLIVAHKEGGMSPQERVLQAWQRLQDAKKDAPFSKKGRVKIILLRGQYRLLSSKLKTEHL